MINIDKAGEYVKTISNMTNRFKYYGNADINRISFYKLYLKYRDTLRDSDIDECGISYKRKFEIIERQIENNCNDIVKTK